MNSKKQAHLRKLATAATPGPYRTTGPSSVVGCALSAQPDPQKNTQVLGSIFTPANAAYFAALSPGDVLSLLDQLAEATARATKAESRAAELRGQVTGLLEDLANGCVVAGDESDPITGQCWHGVNQERRRNLEWAALKCKELGIEWPIKPIPSARNLPESAPAPLPSSPAAAGPVVSVLSGQHYQHYKGGEYVVLCVAKVEADTSQEVVVYQDAEHKATYSRPVAEFCAPRFVLLPGPRTSTLLVGDITKGEPSFKDWDDEREIIGTYETSGLPAYEGDDYVTDVEGCYLTRAEAEELKADELRAPTTTGEGKGAAAAPLERKAAAADSGKEVARG